MWKRLNGECNLLATPFIRDFSFIRNDKCACVAGDMQRYMTDKYVIIMTEWTHIRLNLESRERANMNMANADCEIQWWIVKRLLWNYELWFAMNHNSSATCLTQIMLNFPPIFHSAKVTNGRTEERYFEASSLHYPWHWLNHHICTMCVRVVLNISTIFGGTWNVNHSTCSLLIH